MKLVSFFVLSVSLHATALVYPVSFGGLSQPEIIRVAILPIEQESIGVGGHGGTGKAALQGGLKSDLRIRPNLQPGVEVRQGRDPEPQSPGRAAANTADTSVALVSALADSVESHGSALTGIANNGAYGSGADGNATGIGKSDGGMGLGTRGGGMGNGYG